MKKTVVPRENNQSAESNRQTLSQNYIYIKKNMNIKFSPTLTYLYILSLAGFVRMDFSEQYYIKGKA
jgi:hypothetical protein